MGLVGLLSVGLTFIIAAIVALLAALGLARLEAKGGGARDRVVWTTAAGSAAVTSLVAAVFLFGL